MACNCCSDKPSSAVATVDPNDVLITSEDPTHVRPLTPLPRLSPPPSAAVPQLPRRSRLPPSTPSTARQPHRRPLRPVLQARLGHGHRRRHLDPPGRARVPRAVGRPEGAHPARARLCAALPAGGRPDPRQPARVPARADDQGPQGERVHAPLLERVPHARRRRLHPHALAARRSVQAGKAGRGVAAASPVLFLPAKDVKCAHRARS